MAGNGSAAQVVVEALNTLLVNDGFLCFGTETNHTEHGSKLLPADAGNDTTGWSLCYRRQPSVNDYELKAVKMGDVLVVHMMADSQLKTCNVSLGQCVQGGQVDLETLKKSLQPIWDAWGNDQDKKKNSETETDSERARERDKQTSSPDSLGAPPRHSHPSIDPFAADYGIPDMHNPARGYGDVDRLPQFGAGPGFAGGISGGVGGGGMWMGPPFARPNISREYEGGHGVFGLPRGSIPRGARFDPFGPPLRGPSGGAGFADPDPDHMPPPGYGNMFM